MTDMNRVVRLQVRSAVCSNCRLSGFTHDHMDICVTGTGPETADVMVVSKSMGGKEYHRVLSATLARVGINPHEVFHTGAVKCRVFDIEAGRRDIKACAEYLEREIDIVAPRFILALGNEALQALTGRSGITKYRGRLQEHSSGAKIFPTISPAMVMRNPGAESGFVADLQYFASLVDGKIKEREPILIQHVMTTAALKELPAVFEQAEAVSFDVESTGFNEWDDDAVLVSISCSLRMPDGKYINYAVPLFHPQSPFRKDWLKVLRFICRLIGKRRKRIAHNGKFDLRWMRQFSDGTADWALTFDTMIAAHLLDEARTKALKPLGQQLLGAEPWGIDTHDLLNTPLHEVLEYNGLDTYWTIRLWWESLRPDLMKQKLLAKVMGYILVPASDEVTWSESRGIWVDVLKMQINWATARAKLEEIESLLMVYVPENHPFKEINFNPSNFLRWWLFEHLELPVLARGKRKEDGREGDPSVAEAVMMSLAETHEVPKLLLQRTDWARKCGSFFKPWAEQLDENDRIHTTYKLTGTTTGRLSSGKPDADKVTAKKQIRGVNIQQVPRDPLMRGVFGAQPGFYFVQGDQSQVELRIAAELSGERNMIWHYREGLDLHTAMAERMTGKSREEILSDPVLASQWKEIRKRAKPVNFGYLYGMSWMKFQATAWVNYGLRFTDEEAQASRQAFFDMWPDLPPWHAKQKRLVHKYKRVISPLGRIRHLPDIDSPMREVQAEAERQAINSPVQSLASDLTLMSLTLISKDMRSQGMRSGVVGTVHDSILFEVAEEEMSSVLPLIKDTMENPPLEKWFGYNMRIPLVADLSVGHHWAGDSIELKPEQVYNWSPSILTPKAA